MNAEKSTPTKGRCNAETGSESYCLNYPARDDDGEIINGRCFLHGGHPDSGRPAEDDFEAVIQTNRSEYYQKQSPDDQAWIDGIIESALEDAEVDLSDTYKVELVRQMAICMHKLRESDDYIHEEGHVQEKVVGQDEQTGELLYDIQENVLNKSQKRWHQMITKTMKTLGLDDSAESKAADGIESIAAVFAQDDD